MSEPIECSRCRKPLTESETRGVGYSNGQQMIFCESCTRVEFQVMNPGLSFEDVTREAYQQLHQQEPEKRVRQTTALFFFTWGCAGLLIGIVLGLCLTLPLILAVPKVQPIEHFNP